MERASSRVSGLSEFEGLFMNDEDDDLSDFNASQESEDKVLQDDSIAEQESRVDDSFQEEGFGFPGNIPLEGDRGLSRRSSQRTPGGPDPSVRSDMLYHQCHQCEDEAPESNNSNSDQAMSVESEHHDVESSFHNKGLYKEYAHTNKSPHRSERKHTEVSEEIKELFQFIDRFKPRELELSTLLKPFIPDFIPAVGGVDEFIKIPRPDGQPDFLGLKVLDERGPKQSDAAVINLQLRASSMHSNLHPLQVASVENPEKNPKKLDAWINSIKELHRSKPPPAVCYSKPMPSIDKLIQEWPADIEKLLGSVELPTEKLDLDIGTFSDVCCSILDIPVYKSRIESLHLLFSLYLELKNANPFPPDS